MLHTPWLYLTFRANPTIIHYGSKSILTANFNHHTDGKKVTPSNPVNGHIPNGSPVTFTTNLGNVGSNTIEKYTKQGLTYTILHGDKGTGYTMVKLIADGQILYNTITIMPVSNTSNTTEKNHWNANHRSTHNTIDNRNSNHTHWIINNPKKAMKMD